MAVRLKSLDIVVNAKSFTDFDIKTDLIVMFIAEDLKMDKNESMLNDSFDKNISLALKNESFSAEPGKTILLHTYGKIKADKVLITGLGDVKKIDCETLRKASSEAYKAINKKSTRNITILLPENDKLLKRFTVFDLTKSICEGFMLSSYEISLKTNTDKLDSMKIEIATGSRKNLQTIKEAIHYAQISSEGVFVARDLSTLPPNIATPEYLAKSAISIAGESKLKVTILGREQIEELKMGAFLSVARASAREPQFIIMEHLPENSENLKTVVLIGKGITFDTGGYSMKPAASMIGMKYDMAGGAAVIGVMRAISNLKIPVNVIGIVPACENMINGEGYLPEDVVTASNGMTIEINSTDAEGRMLLADAMIYAKKYNPDAVIDIATLTGLCAQAFAGVASGLFANDDILKNRLLNAARITDERLWHLPMYDEFGECLKSEIADTKNSGKGGIGSATMFLKKFADFQAWAHIDMAGLASDDRRSYNKKGIGSGYGVRLLLELVRQYT
ncbi:MAG: leucyl aminopeptidase [Candidatus Delongbacteria bacterium]|nr:leucyl aminopeptidase [Candidatus Delongbacteria bacterium]MBN2833351.1 leucyl aminopeptidase [Candidatus Delongbacteria bacterium]